MELTRLGTDYGGWAVPVDLLGPGDVCYCAGVGEDASFDVALVQELGCEVYALDPTPRAAAHIDQLKRRAAAGRPMPINNRPERCYAIPRPRALDRLYFLPLGLHDRDEAVRFYEPADPSHVSHSIVNLQQTEKYFVAECRTVRSLMRHLGHSRVDLLKLDIEGAEIAVLDRMMADGVFPRLLCVEFDLALQRGEHARALRQMRDLIRCGYELLVEDQWNCTFVHRGRGSRWIPRLARRVQLAWRGRRAA